MSGDTASNPLDQARWKRLGKAIVLAYSIWLLLVVIVTVFSSLSDSFLPRST